MNIHESAEDYLEAILRLKEAKGYARSVDISLLLGVTKPSVSVAMKRLRENGYLTMDADNLITLTPTGMEIARSIYDRHKTLSSFLESLGVDSDVVALQGFLLRSMSKPLSCRQSSAIHSPVAMLVVVAPPCVHPVGC